MLGLAQQVGCDDHGVCGLVGDDRDLARPCGQVNGDAAEQLALGLCDVRVAGAHDHVRGCVVEQAESERCDGLHSADRVGAIDAGCVGREEHGIIRCAVRLRGRCGRDHGHTGLLGDADRHECARGQREPARWQIGADLLHGHVAHAADDAGSSLERVVLQLLT